MRYARGVSFPRAIASVLALIAALGCAGVMGCRRRPNACGAAISSARLWLEISDAEMTTALASAQSCARSRGTRVILEFIAPWCPDCLEMTRLEQTPEVARVLHDRYERVRVNVGNWDRHAALRQRYGIDRIAAYVVLDADGRRVAQTVVEPVTGGHGPMTAAQWIAWLEAPR